MKDALFRPGTDADIDQVADLLHQHMNRKVPPETFRRLMDYGWAGEKPHVGMVVEADGQIVGFHGNVYSTRFLPDGPRVFGSFTSLYIHRDWRGENLGLRMMQTYEARPDITYTVFDPSKRVHAILEQCGFRDLDLNRYVWQADGVPGDIEVIEDPDRIAPRVSEEERRYLHDHRDMKAFPVLLSGPAGDVLSFFLRQDRGDKGFCHDLIYTGDPAKLAAMIDAAAPRILGDDPRARLLADERFFNGNAVGGRKEPLQYRRMVRRADPALPDWRVDHLYTETLLIDLKLG
ncbi:MAG: N-acetyltransferase family protein [Minwuia sp.]|uniref:GNAT family N-acetyltransferase n=1 Tax=Minwuia sp. TaxID=2493630 RepID=UPI003A862441